MSRGSCTIPIDIKGGNTIIDKNRHVKCPMTFDSKEGEYLCGNICCIDCELEPCGTRCEKVLIKKCNE